MTLHLLLFRRFAAAALWFSLALSSSAQVVNGKTLVTASLVADTTSIVAGRPFTVGVRLQLAPGWHTYWQHPGESGGPPRVEWQLPPGFSAGPIQWPIPHSRLDEGDLLTYVYEGDLILPVEITPPAQLSPGDVKLSASVKWLVCEKICVPGAGEVTLALPAEATSHPAQAELFTKARAQLPRLGTPPFQIAWERSADALTLRLTGLPKTTTAEFFPLPPAGVTLGHPQADPVGDDGTRTIKFPLSTGGTTDLAWSGVLVLSPEGAPREGWMVSSPPAKPPAPTALPSAATGGLAWKLLVALLGGLIMNVMPCVLPVLALKIFGFVQQAGTAPGRVFRLGLAFAGGVFAFFFGLAALVSQLRGAFNFGYQFQNPWLLTAMIALVFVFALNLLGVFEIALSGQTATALSELSGREGYGGAFLHGLFTTLLGTSCTAPFLGGSLGFAVTQPTPIVFLLFGAIATGLSLPYVLLTAQPAWLRFLPKPGLWMERVKQVMGFAMLAVVVWLLGVVAFRGAHAVSSVSWFLLFLGLACWIYGNFARSLVTGMLIFLLTVGGGWAFLRGAFAEPIPGQASAPGSIAWQPFSEETLAAALARGDSVFIDFTAEWCVNCKVFERTVLETAPIQRVFRDRKILALRADWTHDDPAITSALKRFGRVSVPLYVIHRPGQAEPIILDALTPALLLGYLGK